MWIQVYLPLLWWFLLDEEEKKKALSTSQNTHKFYKSNVKFNVQISNLVRQKKRNSTFPRKKHVNLFSLCCSSSTGDVLIAFSRCCG